MPVRATDERKRTRDPFLRNFTVPACASRTQSNRLCFGGFKRHELGLHSFRLHGGRGGEWAGDMNEGFRFPWKKLEKNVQFAEYK